MELRVTRRETDIQRQDSEISRRIRHVKVRTPAFVFVITIIIIIGLQYRKEIQSKVDNIKELYGETKSHEMRHCSNALFSSVIFYPLAQVVKPVKRKRYCVSMT